MLWQAASPLHFDDAGVSTEVIELNCSLSKDFAVGTHGSQP